MHGWQSESGASDGARGGIGREGRMVEEGVRLLIADSKHALSFILTHFAYAIGQGAVHGPRRGRLDFAFERRQSLEAWPQPGGRGDETLAEALRRDECKRGIWSFEHPTLPIASGSLRPCHRQGPCGGATLPNASNRPISNRLFIANACDASRPPSRLRELPRRLQHRPRARRHTRQTRTQPRLRGHRPPQHLRPSRGGPRTSQKPTARFGSPHSTFRGCASPARRKRPRR